MTNARQLDKSALRAAARERRRGANRQAGQALRDVLLGLPELQTASCVAAYVARSAEPDTAPILAELAAPGSDFAGAVVLEISTRAVKNDQRRIDVTEALAFARKHLAVEPSP